MLCAYTLSGHREMLKELRIIPLEECMRLKDDARAWNILWKLQKSDFIVARLGRNLFR